MTVSSTASFGIETSDEQNLSFDPESGRFIYTVKRGNQFGRAVALATTGDFYDPNATVDFGLVFGADELDQGLGRKRIADWLKTCPGDLACTNEFCPSALQGREGNCWKEEQVCKTRPPLPLVSCFRATLSLKPAINVG